MIKQAHVGVGIKDGENSHAAGSSDLAIRRVGELPKLIFYHGKQNWERNTRMTHLITSMKMTVVLCLLFYDVIVNRFTARSLFSGPMLLAYNFFLRMGDGSLRYRSSFVHWTRRGARFAAAIPFSFDVSTGGAVPVECVPLVAQFDGRCHRVSLDHDVVVESSVPAGHERRRLFFRYDGIIAGCTTGSSDHHRT